MKNENKQPEYLTVDKLCKLTSHEIIQYEAVLGALCTGGFQELTPDQIETYKKSNVTAAVRYKLKQPLAPESKEVESVPVKSAEEILATIQGIDYDITHNVDYLLYKSHAIDAMETYASQFKQPANNEAAKLIEERIKELEPTPTGWQDSERMILIEELKHILKLIQ